MMFIKFISLLLLVSLVVADEDDEDFSVEDLPSDLSGIDLKSLLPAELNLQVVSGEEVQPHQYPFEAFIITKLPKEKERICGGTLLTSRYILTAAHCLKGGLNATVILGAHDITKNETDQVTVPSRRLKMHEKYNSLCYSNDIGLVELDFPVSIGANINITTLPTRSYARKSLNKKNATTIGWSYDATTPTNSSVILQEVQDVVLSNFQCWLKFPFNVKKTNICLKGKKGNKGCGGDAGGPLLVDGFQVGVASFGAKGCNAGLSTAYPSVFTRISRYLKWIEKNTDYEIQK